jgi:hypothetical protein
MFVRTGTPLPRYDSTPSVQGNDDEDVDMITGHAEAQEEEALVIQTQMREDAVVLTAVAAEEVKAEQDPEADNLESVQMERYASFLEGFVPEKFGGHLETTLHFKNGAFFEERDEVQTLWRGNADVFKYIPGNMAFSTNKLLLLALWPDLVNFSDDVVLCLLQFLNDLQHFDGEEKGQFVDAVTKNSTVNIDLVATQAFHCGALTKAGLSALHGCLRADSFNDVQVLQSKSFDQWAYALHNLQKDRNTETLQVFVGKLRKILIPEADWKRDGLPRLLLHRFWDVENERRQGDRFASMITQAQELDSLYASMVHGASVKIPLTPDIWCPSHNIASTLFGMRESEQFFKVSGFPVFCLFLQGQNSCTMTQDMWNSLGVVAVDWHEKQMISSGRRGPSGSLSIKDAVHLMRMTWEQSKLFRVSDAVMMTEKQVSRMNLSLFFQARLSLDFVC